MRLLLLRAVGVLLGGIAGYEAIGVLEAWTPFLAASGDFLLTVSGVVAGGLLGLLLFPALARGFVGVMAWVLHPLAALSLRDLILALGGLLAGLALAFVAAALLGSLPLVGPYVRPVAGVVFGYLGLHLALQRREEIGGLVPRGHAGAAPEGPLAGSPKLLDTSVIIDGRIADICSSGFLEGPVVVPRSVLGELQRIADSPDALRRNRGRRGLDILNRLQKTLGVEILEDHAGGTDVDAQLIALARARSAAIVTTDLNLSKVAELQGVRVLNVNELVQALRPAVLPGEDLSVNVIRDGKEAGQGIGYLDDGTMIVVEGGRRHIGETLEVTITSVLQTSAGRMIFARPRTGETAGRPPAERR